MTRCARCKILIEDGNAAAAVFINGRVYCDLCFDRMLHESGALTWDAVVNGEPLKPEGDPCRGFLSWAEDDEAERLHGVFHDEVFTDFERIRREDRAAVDALIASIPPRLKGHGPNDTI